VKKISGVVQALVTNVEDPEGLGRVQLEFPWLDEAYRTNWTPIATPLTGGQRGQFFMPEVGDEALVAFEHGDFDHPFVVGFLWNGVDKPPETEVQNRVILTPGGHTLRFEDKDGSRKVVLKSTDGHHLTIDDAGHEITVSDSDGNNRLTIQITAGQIKIEAATNVTLEAPAINLVDGSTHPLVFGDQLLSYLNQLVALYNSHTHPFFATPAPPFTPALPVLISTRVTTG
jgi:phage baseplate assembly protein V